MIKNSVIPGRKNRKIEIEYDKKLYKQRNVVERFFLKIKAFRKVATRYEQTSNSFLGLVKLTASIVIIRSMNVDVV